MTKFNESSLPNLYASNARKNGFTWFESHTVGVYQALLVSMAEYLRVSKSTDTEKTAVVVHDLGADFMFAGVLTYTKGEDEDMPGNYSIEYTFDKADIDGAKVVSFTDQMYTKVFLRALAQLAFLRPKKSSFVAEIVPIAINTLHQWADVNAKEGEPETITIEGIADIKAGIVNGQKVLSIDPSGLLKKLVKDDSTLEALKDQAK